MRKLVYLIVPVLVLSIAGCASTSSRSGKPKKKDIQGRLNYLENKVDALEQQGGTPAQAEQQYSAPVSQPSVSRSSSSQSGDSCVSSNCTMSKKEVQTALKSAGFYTGAIDGVCGSKTKQAVRDFQSANGLTADGVVGAKTSKALQKYL